MHNFGKRHLKITNLARALGLLAVMAVYAGCSKPSATSGSAGSNGSEAAPQNRAAEQCNDIINSFFDMAQPDNLGISSEVKSATTLLNEWSDSCGTQSTDGTATLDVAPELERLVPVRYLPDIATARFLTRDVMHVRDCLTFRKMAYSAIANSEDERGRIVDLFYYVTRTVAPLPTQAETIPLTVFDVVTLGRGTANDRALVYAGLLRQLNIDCVIIRPQTSAGTLSEVNTEAAAEDQDAAEPAEETNAGREVPPFLLGVISGSDIYLFDPKWGLPIPSKAEATGTTWDIRQPATLQEVLADATILQALTTDADNPYPIQMADLQNLTVELIGDCSLWAPRMQTLQDSMSGDRNVLIYDPVEDLPERLGLLTRVASVDGAPWKREDIRIWDHPEEVLRAIETLEGNEFYLQNLIARKIALNAPLAIANEGGTAQFGPPTGGVLRTRIQQMIGNYKEAIPSYVTIKLDCITVVKTPFPDQMKQYEPQFKQMHAMAADDVSYWIGLAQIALGEDKAAEDSLRSYMSQYRSGRWLMQNLSTFANTLARQGKYFGAISFLEKAPDIDPQKPSYGYLIQRWKRLANAQEQASGE